MTTNPTAFTRIEFPTTPAAYAKAVHAALWLVKRSDPTHMLAAAPNTLAECFADEVQPEPTARCILDDAMTGQPW